MRGEFAEDVPLWGRMRWEPGDTPGSVCEVPPDACPAGHPMRRGATFRESWNPHHFTRAYLCLRCQAEGREMAEWAAAVDMAAMWRAHLEGGGELTARVRARLADEGILADVLAREVS